MDIPISALTMPATSGYQWKRLFLPNGTLLRTVFNGKNTHCLVEGDQILYDGKAISPSGFVNAAGGIRRNAWKSTWIIFPDSKHWTLADTLRPARPKRARRPPVTAAQRAPAAQPPTACPPEPVLTSTQADHHQVAQTNANGAARRRERRQTPLPSRENKRATEHGVNWDERIVALLRQKLQPFLLRIVAIDTPPHPTDAALSG
jgi:hypothetical protein